MHASTGKFLENGYHRLSLEAILTKLLILLYWKIVGSYKMDELSWKQFYSFILYVIGF